MTTDRAQEAPPEGSVQVDPMYVIQALQKRLDETGVALTMHQALVAQLQAQVAELTQELAQTRLERDALAETRAEEKTPAKS